MRLYETLDYEVIDKLAHHITIRKYDSFNIAITTAKLDKKLSNGFMNVFEYISGNNTDSQKISMTTPVLSNIEGDSIKTSFVLPKKLKNIPTPTKKNVEIKKIEAGYFIAITFKGSWTKEHFSKYDKILKEAISERGFTTISNQYILRYQPPFLPGFLKRNEIMYRIDYSKNR